MKVQLASLQAAIMSMKKSVKLEMWAACALALMPERQEAGKGVSLEWMNWRPLAQSGDVWGSRWETSRCVQMAVLVVERGLWWWL